MKREVPLDAYRASSKKRKKWAKEVLIFMMNNPDSFYYVSSGDSMTIALRNDEGMEIFECKVKAVWREE